ncbi:protein-PII uridylyltransferase [Vibrio parahaemolyticus]|uniref:hypothetical protein n=1 Tax=Vibrio parahaemolyticus TaxID=670 RepID=UPI001D16B64E|nr:hypothetical protein [Vibrio parahaemolyticus]MCC3832058.1 protein-PII uridylyltransferase [Vibrio parahaemolyticus]
MMPIKYLYVDDDETEKLEELITELEFHAGGQLEITHTQTRPMKDIQKMFSEGGFDGLMIDQKLDAANENGVVAGYWGTSLAQDCRTEMIGNQMVVAPIVLFSNEDVYVKYFDKDQSAHNLFDFTVGKTKVSKSECYAHQASHILIGLATSYKIAKEDVNPKIGSHAKIQEILEPLLNWNDSVYKYCDKRFVEYAESKLEDIHTLISLILHNLVRSAGILVTESMLATRLGVDINRSEGWEEFKTLLEDCKYKGVFSSLKDRWWFSSIEDWWYDNEINDLPLRGLTATQRVESIIEATGCSGLTPLVPKYTNGTQSEKYWVNCIVSDTPLDICDAILVSKPDLMSWEQPIYLDPQVTHDREYDRDKYPVHKDYQDKVIPLYERLTKDGD